MCTVVATATSPFWTFLLQSVPGVEFAGKIDVLDSYLVEADCPCFGGDLVGSRAKNTRSRRPVIEDFGFGLGGKTHRLDS